MRKSEATEEAKWEVKSLGRLCDLLNGLAFKPEDWIEFGLPIIRIQNLNGGAEFNFCDGTKVPEAYIITPGTLLFSWSGNRGTSFGPYIWNGPKGALNQHIFKVTEKPNINRRWLFYALDEVRQKAERAAHGGSGLVHVRRGDLLLYTINTPLEDEQRHIAEVLDTIEAAIQRADTLINKLKWMKLGLLHDLLTCGLDGDGELRDSVRYPEQFKDSPLGLIPKNWELTTLKAAVLGGGGNIQTGPFGSQLHAYEYALEGTPVVMPQDIQQGLISEEHIARVPAVKATAMSRHQFKLNDVVFARRGDLERCAAIAEREVGWLCGTGCLLVRPPKNELNGKWLAATYRHDRSQRQILARAVGSTMVNLSAGLLGTLLIAKPKFEEQTAIVEKLDIQDQRIHAEETNRDKLIQIKKGLMHDLLTGRVRVPSAKSEVVAV